MKLQGRLKKVMREGNLTVADLSRWLKTPYPTVRNWIVNGVSMGGGQGDIVVVDRRLDQLERLIAKKNKLPVPRMAPTARIKYLTDLWRYAARQKGQSV